MTLARSTRRAGLYVIKCPLRLPSGETTHPKLGVRRAGIAARYDDRRGPKMKPSKHHRKEGDTKVRLTIFRFHPLNRLQ